MTSSRKCGLNQPWRCSVMLRLSIAIAVGLVIGVVAVVIVVQVLS
jgi:hypothetical protein